jgi:uncharacterized protein with GYD domain
MALYLTQFTYTPEAWAALATNPADRRTGLAALFERMGGRLLEFYYCFGEYDGVVISEFPDETAYAAGIIAAVAPGHLKSVKTTPLLNVDQTMEALRRAGDGNYAAPSR